MLEKLQKKESFLLLLAERVQKAIPFFPSFTGAGSIRDVSEVNWKRIVD